MRMNHFDEVGVSKHVPISHLNSSTMFETVQGQLGVVFKISGVPFETERNDVLNQYQQTWQRAIAQLDERFAVYVTIHHHCDQVTLPGDFAADFCRQLDDDYQRTFQDQRYYVNDLYLTLIYKGIAVTKPGLIVGLLQGLTQRAVKKARQLLRHSQIAALMAMANRVSALLSPFSVRLLGENDKHLGYSELLQFLGMLVNGGKQQQYAPITMAMPIYKSLMHAKKDQHYYPCSHIGQYLSIRQIFFGEAIQLHEVGDQAKQYAAILSIKQYSAQTASIYLNTLLHLPYEFIATHSFCVEPKDRALHKIQKQIIKMHNVADPAVSQLSALEVARDQLACGECVMGYHHHSIMIIEDKLAYLENACNAVIKCYADAGMVAVRESLGKEAAYWAQIPGNTRYIARTSLVTSHNFTDFAPLHNYRYGYHDQNHLTAAVSLLRTPANTPYYFNFHVKGEKNNPSKGHTMIIGGNGAGKTVLMCFLDAQLSRYSGASYYFDRDRGAEIYIRACGGYYASLSPDNPDDTCFNPFSMPDTAANRQFNRDLIAAMCKASVEDVIDVDSLNQIKQCIDYGYDELSDLHRTLSNVCRLLPVNFPYWPSLRRWLRGAGRYDDGEYAYIFDNVKDKFSQSDKVGFDLTHFLDREPAAIRTVLMMYLCQRIDNQLSGRLAAIYFDEGWQNLVDPYWQKKLQRWLPTLRKRNAFIVMATQSITSIIQSPLFHVFIDNVATQIYFANPMARHEEYVDRLHLTESEFSCVVDNVPESRLFLIKQGKQSALCLLDLSNIKKYLSVLSANAASVKYLEQLRKKLGNYPQQWLEKFMNKQAET